MWKRYRWESGTHRDLTLDKLGRVAGSCGRHDLNECHPLCRLKNILTILLDIDCRLFWPLLRYSLRVLTLMEESSIRTYCRKAVKYWRENFSGKTSTKYWQIVLLLPIAIRHLVRGGVIKALKYCSAWPNGRVKNKKRNFPLSACPPPLSGKKNDLRTMKRILYDIGLLTLVTCQMASLR